MVALHNQESFEPEASSVFQAPEPRLVRISGGWFGEMFISIGKPVEEVLVPDYVDDLNYEESKQILETLSGFYDAISDGDDREELAYRIKDLQMEIDAYEESLVGES